MNQLNKDHNSTAQEQAVIWGSKPEDWADLMEDKKIPIYKTVLEKLSSVADMDLLDVGCGGGTFCSLAYKQGARVHGLDASFPLISLARKRIPDGDFRVGHIEYLPFKEKVFDVITGFNSFQYAFDPLAAVQEAYRVAKSGAFVIMAIWGHPDDCDAMAYIKTVVSLLPPSEVKGPGPFDLSTDGKLWSFIEKAGFKPLDQIDVYTPWVYPDEDTALRSLLSSGPAVKAIFNSGEDKVRELLRDMLQRFKKSSGGFQLDNSLKFVLARVP